MKKVTYSLILTILAIPLPGCYKANPKSYLPDQLSGLWSQTSLHYKAYKGAELIEEYTEATEDDKQITILFYKNGTFETDERSREDGRWEVTEHITGTCRYIPDTGTLIMEDKTNGAYSEAKVLTLTGQQLTLSQSAAPASHNPKADKELFIADFTRGPFK